jgi:chromosome segregation ATPase
MLDPLMTSADLAAEREQLLSQLRMLEASKARIQTELKSEATWGKDGGTPDEWTALEQNYLSSEAVRVEGERRSLSETAGHLENRINFLKQEVETRHRASDLDTKNESEIQERLAKGLTDRGRLTDAQRATLESAARLRQAMAELADAERQLVEVKRTRARLVEERATALSRELIRTEGEISSAKSRLTATTFKLGYAGRSGRRVGSATRSYAVKLIRSTTDGPREFDATLDTQLQPGDVLECSLVDGREESSRVGNSG